MLTSTEPTRTKTRCMCPHQRSNRQPWRIGTTLLPTEPRPPTRQEAHGSHTCCAHGWLLCTRLLLKGEHGGGERREKTVCPQHRSPAKRKQLRTSAIDHPSAPCSQTEAEPVPRADCVRGQQQSDPGALAGQLHLWGNHRSVVHHLTHGKRA